MSTTHGPTLLLHLAAAFLVLAAHPTPAAGPAPPELLFKVTFDDLSANAEFAKGSGKSTLPRNLGLTAKPGVKGVGLALLDGETCHYPVAGNLNVESGTVSFWVKPRNWTGKEGRYQKFFWVYGRENGVPFSLYVDSPNRADNARLCISLDRRGEPGYRLYQVSGKADWASGRWHKIDATWGPGQIAIYVNGRLGQRLDIDGSRFPALEHEVFRLVPIFHAGDGRFHNAEDRSFIDEVEIWSAPLSADRILERYLADTGGRTRPPRATVGRAAGPITVDGKLDEESWRRASRVPILSNTVTGFPHSLWARAALCYDRSNLYIGLTTPQPGPPAARAAGRDGRVWEDDSFEVFLVADMARKDAFFQFIVNAEGIVFDGRGGRSEWDGNITVGTSAGEGSWSLEMAVPFETLGVAAPAPGTVWRANFCRDWAREKPLKPIYTSWAYVGGSFLANQDRWGEIRFEGSDAGVRLDLSPVLNSGTIRLTVTARPPRSRVTVRIKSEGETKTFEGVTDADGVCRIDGRLEGIKEGLCEILVSDPNGTERSRLQTRFLVRETVQVAYLPDPVRKRLGLIVDLSGVDDDWLEPVAGGRATLALNRLDPAGTRRVNTFRLEGLSTQVEIPFEFAEGMHRMEYRLTEPGHAQPLVTERSLEIPPLPWVGTDAGITDQVLEPWTPLEFGEGGEVSCWGRKYTFAGPFLKSAVNRGRELLGGPVELTLETAATGSTRFVSTETRTVLEKPHRAEYAGRGEFPAAGIGVDWAMWMEYDGLSVVRFTLRPSPGAGAIRRLSLRIPLRGDVVKYLRGRKARGGILSGRTKWDGKLWQGGFEPFVWIVNEEEGFLYFCENEANWVYDKGENVVTVRGGDEAAIELTLIAKEIPADRALTYEIGFQATPVKPMMKNRREWNFDMHRETAYQNARNWFTRHARQVGTWKVDKPDVIREFDQELRAQGIRLFYYGVTSCTPNRNPTYDLFRKLWDSPYPASFGPYTYRKNPYQDPHPPYRQAAVSPASPTFQDMMLYYADEMLREIGAAGLYTDTDGVWACDNEYIGSKFTDAFGRTGVTYTILSKRRFAKRLAAIVRTVGGERRYWMTHAHAKLVPPVHAWADFWLPGEELTHRLYGDKWFYMDTLDETYFRQEFRGRTSGLAHVILPEFIRGTKDKADGKGPQPTESLLAMCAVTDVTTTGAYLNSDALGVYWTLRHDLGIVDSDFVGYWQAGCPVRTTTDGARVSLYTTERAYILAVANRLPRDNEISLELDLESLALNDKPPARDARTGERLACSAGRIAVRVPRRNYTFVGIDRTPGREHRGTE